MEGWLYATRIPALSNAKLTSSSTKEEMNAQIPAPARWKADNFNHLLEQPTQFYAVALTIALLGKNHEIDTKLAWTYVGLRVLHSLVQALGNNIPVRFSVFITSSVTLLGLTARAALDIWRAQ